MLLAILRRIRAGDDGLDPSRTGETSGEDWFARADEALAAARAASSIFERDALYDQVVTAMVHATLPTLARFCQHKLPGDPIGAEDAVQASYLAFREALPTFEARSSLKTFLYAIAFNRCRDQRSCDARRAQLLRRNAGHVADTLHGGLEAHDLDRREVEEEARLRARDVERVLGVMPAREAYILRARLIDERDYADILPEYQRRFGDGITTPARAADALLQRAQAARRATYRGGQVTPDERDTPDEVAANEVAAFESAAEPIGAELEARVLARLDEASTARHERGLALATAAIRGRRATRSPLSSPLTWTLVALAAAASVWVTIALTPDASELEYPAAFAPTLPPPHAVAVDIRYDDRGRLSRIAPATETPPADGEHLIFRAGHLIRIEHYRKGVLDGPAYDFDADGGLVAIRTWALGVERGPFIELDGKGRVLGSGVR